MDVNRLRTQICYFITKTDAAFDDEGDMSDEVLDALDMMVTFFFDNTVKRGSDLDCINVVCKAINVVECEMDPDERAGFRHQTEGLREFVHTMEKRMKRRLSLMLDATREE